MSKIKSGGLDQYGAEPFEQQQFGTAGVEGVKLRLGGTACKQSETSENISEDWGHRMDVHGPWSPKRLQLKVPLEIILEPYFHIPDSVVQSCQITKYNTPPDKC